jgi:hypothetical protein
MINEGDVPATLLGDGRNEAAVGGLSGDRLGTVGGHFGDSQSSISLRGRTAAMFPARPSTGVLLGQ